MTKKFDNISADGKEKAIRRGFTVPEGAVNLAWAKAPRLSPENNVIIIDTSKVVSENQSISFKRKNVAFSNVLGILEDEDGNQIWDEEYPIISDVFSLPDSDVTEDDYVSDAVLPYVHVSRYFHVDFLGLAFASLSDYNGAAIKVVDKNGLDYVDDKGKKKYKIALIQPSGLNFPANSRESAYRVYAFLDMDLISDELYLMYDKIEINTGGGIKEQVVGHKELINSRTYFKYAPEETDVVDHANLNQKIYSSKPSNLKQQILGLPQPNFTGWKYFVPRKAIPDPRIFQVFRWRLACEITKPAVPENTGTNLAPVPSATINVGVVIPPNGDWSSTRANYFFYELNQSDYNFSNIKFVNPLKTVNNVPNSADQAKATYWHVDISKVSLADLNKFDILLWAPSADAVDITPYATKINYFVEQHGGTFIFETSSLTNFTNIPDIKVSTSLSGSTLNPSASTYVTASTLRLYDATPDITTDTFNTYGMWNQWPPNVAGILNNYKDIGSILASADVIAGWALDTGELASLSGYTGITNAKFQYISSYGDKTYSPVLEAKNESQVYKKTVVHRKFDSGGNIFVSTSCLFEDHLFEVAGDMASRSMQISSIDDLAPVYVKTFKQMVSSQVMEGEMKLRLNAMLFSTINKPSPTITTTSQRNQGINLSTEQSTTIYGDWNSSWVINPENDVLSEKDKIKYNFAFLPTKADDVAPTWQRILSDKTAKQIIQDRIAKLDPLHQNPLLNAFEGASKRYFIIETNPLVQVFTSDNISDSTIPTAWTNAYSPSFILPTHLGSYVVRDEMQAGSGIGEGKRIYPPKSYRLQTNVSFMNSSTVQGTATASVVVAGTYLLHTVRPPHRETRNVWIEGTAARLVDVVLHWNTDGTGRFENGYVGNTYYRQGQWPKPIGMDTWTSANYGLANNWPYPGISGTLSLHTQANRSARVPSSYDFGTLVLIAQMMLNQLIYFGVFPGPFVPENGVYGQSTANAVIRLQSQLGAKYIDGIIDAETWSLIMYQQIGISLIPGWDDPGHHPPGLTDVVTYAKTCMMLNSISDDNPGTYFMSQSWETNGPSVISEGFLIQFNQALAVYKVSIMPMTAGTQTNSLTIDWVDVQQVNGLAGYNFGTGFPGPVYGKTGGDGQWIDIDIAPWMFSKSVVFKATQSGPAGWGTTRIIGIRDVAVYAKREIPGTPGYYRSVTVTIPGSVSAETQPFGYAATMKFTAGVPVTISALQGLSQTPLGLIQGQSVSDVQWTPASLNITPGDVGNAISSKFTSVSPTTAGQLNSVSLTYQGFENALSSEVFVNGPKIGDASNSYYTKSKAGVIDPYARNYGWIQKDEGMKLICKADGTPYGFPAALPSQVTTSAHFARYKLAASETDQTVYYGFYDVARDEYITNSYGEPEVSYYDYIRRGPQNIFISVMTTYELQTNDNIPGTLDPVMHPFKWGMPVYGVTSSLQSKIQLESLSADLGPEDVWAIPIKTGSFGKTITLKGRDEGSFTGYLKNYQGSLIKAFYGVPETNNGPWSSLYGRPYVDVKGEIPLITDDDTIRVRQAPILINQRPTNTPSLADPWQPAFTVFKRDSLSSPWFQLPFTDIKDFNVWDGTIILKSPLVSNDPRLVKVDYTSSRRVYYMKTDGATRINLNPYINDRGDWTNKPLYIYILPEYVLDVSNTLISGSVQSRSVHATTDASIFAPDQVNYDPTAVMLGIVYISSATDIKKLTLLDTRKRGGGISTAYNNRDALTIQAESESYWDIASDTSTSYQKGGYVIVKLPSTMKDDFTLSQIKTVIERNLAVGVAYEIQDLQGNRWSQ